MAEDNTGNRGYLSDSVNEDGLYPIWGVAIGNNDITIGSKSEEAKLWRPDVLEEAADTLEGKDIVVNHENQDAYKKIGEVEEVKYDEEKGVLYRGGIDDDELAEKISRDWLEVSPRIKHTKAHEEIQGVKVPEAIRDFDNLSVVRRGAAQSNELNLGETEELSIEELQDSFKDEDDSVSEYQTITDDTVDELQEDVDYSRWMFEDRNGAEGATDKFNCEGTHSHEVDGKTWYMPCGSHDKFLKGMKELDNDELEEGVDGSSENESGVDPDEGVEEDEFSEAEYKEYSGEEKRMASQMASYSELTKSECLLIVDVFNPERVTDVTSLSEMLEKVLEKEEMEGLHSQMEKHLENDSSTGSSSDSPLNRLF